MDAYFKVFVGYLGKKFKSLLIETIFFSKNVFLLSEILSSIGRLSDVALHLSCCCCF